MHKKPRREHVAIRAIRPSLEMVERRRRESIADPGQAWWPSAAPLRAAAAVVIVAASAFVVLGLGASFEPGHVSVVQPAMAAGLDWRHVRARADQRRPPRPERRTVPSRDAIAARRHANVAVRASKGAARAHRARGARDDPPPGMPAPPAPSPPIDANGPLTATPWRLTADGTWSAVVSYALPPGSDRTRAAIDFSADVADVLPLDARADGAPGAIITTVEAPNGVVVNAAAVSPAGSTANIQLPAPPSDAAHFAAVAQAIGPHLVDVGWSPLAQTAGVTEFKVYRAVAGEHGKLIGVVSPGGHAWQDASVQPDESYGFTVVAVTDAGTALVAATDAVSTPDALPAQPLATISGKGMFLFFVPDADDPNGYDRYDPAAVVARAKSAGITHIELRMARGTFFEGATPLARAWLDDLIDDASTAGIALVAWQVPRRASSDDAAQAVATARYRTPAGNGFAALALDVEDGENYMGDAADARQRMVDEMRTVREAVGPSYLLVATVMSPALTHWTNARYPYSRIAPYASVLQPMEYWHHFSLSSGHAYTQDEVTGACASSVSLTRSLAGLDLPVDVAGQSGDLGTTGPPSPDEIGWCLNGARSAGAIGGTFFDWRATGDDAWAELTSYHW